MIAVEAVDIYEPFGDFTRPLNSLGLRTCLASTKCWTTRDLDSQVFPKTIIQDFPHRGARGMQGSALHVTEKIGRQAGRQADRQAYRQVGMQTGMRDIQEGREKMGRQAGRQGVRE
jgi:hypothetical protein